MNIGFITYWFERGQAYVTRSLIDAIDGYDPYILARNPGNDVTKSDGEWAHPHLSLYHKYAIPPGVLQRWIQENALSMVFFNEEYDFNLIEAAKAMGVKTIGIYYWELFNPAWAGIANEVFDTIICPTTCTHNKFTQLGMTNLTYIPWGVDLDQFKPARRDPDDAIRFFHPAGWGGMHNRRGTEFVIEAFRKLDNPNAELSIHSQKELDIQDEAGISVICGTIPRDKLIATYQAHDVAVLPSKWEGIGLTHLESLACGLPVITTDAPPMNEFVKAGINGWCVGGDINWYDDIYVPGIHANVDGIADAMLAMQDTEFLTYMKRNALEFSREHLDWSKNGLQFKAIIDELADELKRDTERAITTVTSLIDAEYNTPVDDRVYKRYEKIAADTAIRGVVLDLGCRHGALTFMLTEAGHDVIGVDCSKDAIEICNRLALEKGDAEYPEFQEASIDAMPFPDDHFDTIIMAKVLEHIDNPEHLAEVVRVLKPTGIIIIVTNLLFAHWDPDHRWFFLPRETYQLLHHGWMFKNLETTGTVVAFEDFIEQHFGLACDYQVYNEHESEHDSMEIYCHVYGEDADWADFPALPGEEVSQQMVLSHYET